MREIWMPREAHYTEKEMLDQARAQGHPIDERLVPYWVEIGFLPPPQKDGLAGGGSVAGWTQRQLELFLALAAQYQKHNGHARNVLFNFPVHGWLYWGEGSGVTLEQVKRAMAHWAHWAQRTTRSKGKRKKAVRQLVRDVASPAAKTKRDTIEEITKWLSSQQLPDEYLLFCELQGITAPRKKDKPKSPAEAVFSAGVLSGGIQARLIALRHLTDADLLAKTPDGLWEWARASLAWAHKIYQMNQPELARDPHFGTRFGPVGWEQSVMNSCETLLSALGGGLRALEEGRLLPYFPPQLQPKLWVEGKMQATIKGRWVRSPLALPNGSHPLSVHLEVGLHNKETGETTVA